MTKVIGIVGGMGPLATADFYRRIVVSTRARHDQEHLRVIIDSHPQIPDRTISIRAGRQDPRPAILESVELLEEAGAELIVIACNTAQLFVPTIATGARVPIVDWPEETVFGVMASSPGLATIGLLATDGTITARLFHDAFQRAGVRVVAPTPRAQQQLMAIIYGDEGVKAGRNDLCGARDALQDVAASLVAAGADALLLACTELSVVDAACSAPWPTTMFDAAEIVARRLVQMAGGQLREP